GMKQSFARLESFNTTHNLAVVFSFYTSPNYIFQNDKLRELEQRMGKADRSMFAISPERINWSEYMGNIHLAGLNRYALKDKRRDKSSDAKLAPEATNTITANIA
ncbi:MAG: hypothetical protein NTY70_11565, partial [Burkholderiales bacterium]|nr:hypothetical protein [Burkholderiales bacterium]